MDSGNDSGIRKLWRWATTAPQVYVVYVVALILVWAISFYAGTLNPKRINRANPPPASESSK